MTTKFKSIMTVGMGLTSIALMGILSPAATANDEFSAQAITFDRETSIEFTALESHGAEITSFGVMDMMTGDKTIVIAENQPSDSKNPRVNKANNFRGTPGNAIQPAKNVFKFKPNTPYTLFLVSQNSRKEIVSMVYSLDMRNRNSSQQAKLDKGFEGFASGGIKINWSAKFKPGTLLDKDFNDFVVVARKL